MSGVVRRTLAQNLQRCLRVCPPTSRCWHTSHAQPHARSKQSLAAAATRPRHLRCRAAEVDVSSSEETVQDSALPTGELDLRVGLIKSCERHADADSLYVETINVGDEDLRTIVSGLVDNVPQDAMLNRKVVVICNLKARNMRGVKSHGMVLCASDKENGKVEPLQPPEDAQVGERIFFEEAQPEPASDNRVQKKKLWEAVQPDLMTNDTCIAMYKNVREMMTSAGPVKAASLSNTSIS